MKNKFSDNTSNIDNSPERNQEPTKKGKIRLLDVVALTQDVPEHNLKRGEIGTVVEILANGEAFEVEFSDDNGQMYKCLSFLASQLKVLQHEPISKSKQKQDPTTELTSQTYTALIRESEGWWIGWILEVRGVTCQERTKDELLDTLKITLREVLEFDKLESLPRTESEAEKVKCSDILEFGTQESSHFTESGFEEIKIAI